MSMKEAEQQAIRAGIDELDCEQLSCIAKASGFREGSDSHSKWMALAKQIDAHADVLRAMLARAPSPVAIPEGMVLVSKAALNEVLPLAGAMLVYTPFDSSERKSFALVVQQVGAPPSPPSQPVESEP